MHGCFQITVDQLNRERQDFKRDYANNVNKLKETEIELSTLKSVYKQYVNDVGPKLEAVSRVLEKKIPFLDEGNKIKTSMYSVISNPCLLSPRKYGLFFSSGLIYFCVL